jgi:hypothetical protein
MSAGGDLARIGGIWLQGFRIDFAQFHVLNSICCAWSVFLVKTLTRKPRAAGRRKGGALARIETV